MCRRHSIVIVVALAMVSPGALRAQQKENPFERLDRDQDGKIARDDTPEGLRPTFDAMDADKDGVLTRAEFDAFRKRQQEIARKRLEPTHANVRYGDHDRNLLDLYLAKSDQPTPLVLYIHGGGFQGGDKRTLNAGEAQAYLDAGWSVAAINYRLTDTAPAPAAYLDCARALQFLRHHAKNWNLDPSLVASTGGSAGAGTSLWIAFHDDLADPKSDDPIVRESTRLTCVVVSNGQSSYDPRFAEKIGMPRPNFERHSFFLPFYAIKRSEIDTPQAYKKYEEMAPITYLTKDDPPALLLYSFADEEVTNQSSLNLVVHHPKLGIALKDEMDKLGIECIVQYRDAESGRPVRHGSDEPPINSLQFIRKQFEKAREEKR